MHAGILSARHGSNNSCKKTHACACAQEGLRQEDREARHGDIIISGDLDEVPKPEAVEALRRCGWARQPGCDNCAALEASMYYYSYSNYAGGIAKPPSVIHFACGMHCNSNSMVHATPHAFEQQYSCQSVFTWRCHIRVGA